VRRFAERSAELAREMCWRDMRGASEHRNVQGLSIAGVDEILRAEEVSGRMDGGHRPEYRVPRKAWVTARQPDAGPTKAPRTIR
jgi:hypothetical protein